MKKKWKQWTALILAASMGFMPGCTAPDTAENDVQESAQQESQASADKSGLLEVGDEVAGFTVDSISESGMLSADIINFTHEKSGAKLVYVRNDDTNKVFSISYHTPYVDETDTNHIFEHAILSGSEKYPGSDVFFDAVAKSYNTFLNAFTYNTFTSYPVASESEDQLIKLMDLYMSCMVAPDILKNENIFKREALRYELYAPDEEIQMVGTVYSEDFGSLTDTVSEMNNNVADALFPGQYASNMIGRAHRNYQDLTYEAVVATFDRCYHFDNSLIFLYGDMDYERVLGFLDEEYLSKAEKNGTDLSAYADEPSEDGYVECTVSAPAFEGDTIENASLISYAFSLEDSSWEDITGWNILTSVLGNEQSVFNKILKEKGIQNQAYVSVNYFNAKPYLLFGLYNANPEQSQPFKEAVLETLSQISENGADKNIVKSVLKQIEMSAYILPNHSSVGTDIYPAIVNYWTHTGKTDYYEMYERIIGEIEADSEQAIFRRLASEAENAGRSALVTTVPEAGLAEEIIAEKDAYLAEIKAGMSEDEIQQMIQDTEEFNEWNEIKESNNDFMIDPSDVPELEAFTDYTKSEENGVTFYLAPAQIEKMGGYRLYFDTSSFSNDELLDLELYKLLLGDMATGKYTEEELNNLNGEYLYEMSLSSMCPEDGKGVSHPMMRLSWYGLTEDYEAGLALLIEQMTGTDFTDTERIKELLAKYTDNYDWSRTGDPLSSAQLLAAGAVRNQYAYKQISEGQDFYHYLCDVGRQLEEDESYGARLAERLDAVADKLMQKGRLIFACAAPEETLEEIKKTTAEYAGAFPEEEFSGIKAVMPELGGKLAASIESSDQYTVMCLDAGEESGFRGSYIPFLTALSDQYIVPLLRFQMGAYSGGTGYNKYDQMISVYSYSDPNAAETVKVLSEMPDALEKMELTEEDLNGYILNSLSSASGAVGVLSIPFTAIECEIMGVDNQAMADVANDMKNTSLEDLTSAVEYFKAAVENASIVTLGNDAVLQRDKEAYDKVISFKDR